MIAAGTTDEKKLTLINEHKNAQERRTSNSPLQTPKQHHQGLFDKLLSLEQDHRNEMQRAIDGEHPREDRDEALDFNIGT